VLRRESFNPGPPAIGDSGKTEGENPEAVREKEGGPWAAL
jgi:hypothetical protein